MLIAKEFMPKETHKPIWMVWQIEEGRSPALRAVCTTKKIAERYLIQPVVETPRGFWQIEENLTNHLYGENDYKAFSIVMRKRHEGD